MILVSFLLVMIPGQQNKHITIYNILLENPAALPPPSASCALTNFSPAGTPFAGCRSEVTATTFRLFCSCFPFVNPCFVIQSLLFAKQQYQLSTTQCQSWTIRCFFVQLDLQIDWSCFLLLEIVLRSQANLSCHKITLMNIL